jgi:hypothetical protein
VWAGAERWDRFPARGLSESRGRVHPAGSRLEFPHQINLHITDYRAYGALAVRGSHKGARSMKLSASRRMAEFNREFQSLALRGIFPCRRPVAAARSSWLAPQLESQ